MLASFISLLSRKPSDVAEGDEPSSDRRPFESVRMPLAETLFCRDFVYFIDPDVKKS